jgi:hypothetical protein
MAGVLAVVGAVVTAAGAAAPSHALDGPRYFSHLVMLHDEAGASVVPPAEWSLQITARSATNTYTSTGPAWMLTEEEPVAGTYSIGSVPNAAMSGHVVHGGIRCFYADDSSSDDIERQRRTASGWEVDVHPSLHTTCVETYVLSEPAPASVRGTIQLARAQHPDRAANVASVDDFAMVFVDNAGTGTTVPVGGENWVELNAGTYRPRVVESADSQAGFDNSAFVRSAWTCTVLGGEPGTVTIPYGNTITLDEGDSAACGLTVSDYEVETGLGVDVVGDVDFTFGGVTGAPGAEFETVIEARNMLRLHDFGPAPTPLEVRVDLGDNAVLLDPFLLSQGWDFGGVDGDDHVFVTRASLGRGESSELRLGLGLVSGDADRPITVCVDATEATAGRVVCERLEAVADGGDGGPVEPSPSPSPSPSQSPSPSPSPSPTPDPSPSPEPSDPPTIHPTAEPPADDDDGRVGLPSTGVAH